MAQLIDGESDGPREVMNETYDKSLPVHDPTPRPDEPREVYPFRKIGEDPKDFRPVNTINYAEAPALSSEEEAAEVEEVLEAPKDSPVPGSAEFSTSETTPTSVSQENPASDASAEKDNGQPKEPASGSQTSSLPPMVGEVVLPALEPLPGEENQTPGSPAKQS